MTINLVFIGSLLIVALLGYLLGFAKSLKLTTKGIVGIIISLVVCVMIGASVKNIDVVQELILKVESNLESKWSFLGTIHIGTVIYYIALFIAVQITRIIIIKIICGITESDKKGVKIVNKALGAAFLTTFVFALLLLALAGLKFFEDKEFALKILLKIEDSFLLTLYKHNPIVF